jgi:type IV pilus assembly protein PilX
MNTDFQPAFHCNVPARQRGAVLIVSLLILLIMTMIGVSSLQSSATEEKMASNSRDRNVGFQSAEAALREAEDFLEGLVTAGSFDDTGGLYSSLDNAPDGLDVAPSPWETSGSHRTATAPGGSAGAQYFITRVGTVQDKKSLIIGASSGPGGTNNEITIFQITARGQGANADGAEVMLRSHYGRRM